MQQNFKMTKQGALQLEEELNKLISERGAVAERIKTAREFGDLRENAEYGAAREEQGRAEARIAEIENILKNIQIISTPKKKDIVELGNTVELKNNNGIKKFTIVGSVEANPLEAKISDESPIGKSLIGKKVGEEIEIKTPSLTIKYKITKVS